MGTGLSLLRRRDRAISKRSAAQKKLKLQQRFRPLFQQLEDRHMLDISMSVADIWIDEPTSGNVNATLTVRLDSAPTAQKTITWATAANSATAGSDYTTSNGNLVFDIGQTEKTFTVPILADTAQEVDESFFVNFTPPSGIVGDTQALVTIQDVDVFAAPTRGEENPTVRQEAVDHFGGNFSTALPVAGDPNFLVYRSNTNDRPNIVAETVLTGTRPDEIQAQLTFNGTAGSTIYHTTFGLNQNDTLRFVVQADATGLATGHYFYSLKVSARYGANTYHRTFTGYQNVVKWSANETGNRWNIAQWDQLKIASDGIMLVKGDGSALWYSGAGTYTRPLEDLDFATLVKNGDGTYTRTTKYGDKTNFNSTGQLTSRVDRLGNTTSYSYIDGDSDTIVDEPWKITDAAGRITTMAYASGKLDYIDDFIGRRHDVTITSGNLLSYALPDPDGAGPLTSPTRSFLYGASGGLMSQITDEVSRVTTIAYDFGKRLDVITIPDSNTITVDAAQMKGMIDGSGGLGTQANPAPLYHPFDGFSMVKDPKNNSTEYTHNRFGDVLTIKLPNGKITTYARNTNGLVTQLTPPDPDDGGPLTAPVTNYQYDTLGNLTLLTWPDTKTQSWTYDSTWNVPLSHTDEVSRQTLYTVDSANGNIQTVRNVVGQVDSVGNGETDDVVTTYAYTTTGIKGLVDTITDALGRITDYDYTSHGLVNKITVAKTLGLEAFVTLEYSTADQRTAFVDELLRRTEWQYDNLDRVKQLTEADPDGAGPLTSPITTYEYDAANRPTKMTDPLSHQTLYAYEDFGKRVVETRPDPDGGGSLTSPVTKWQHDAAGNLATLTDPLNRITTYGYDSLNRHTSTTLPDPDAGGPLTSSVYNFAYDNMNRLTSETAPPLGTNTTPTAVNPGTITGVKGGTKVEVDLYSIFADAEDPDSALRYYVESSSSATLFDSIYRSTENPAKMVFDLAGTTTGSSTVVIKAVDTSGASVSSGNFTITIANPTSNEFVANTSTGAQINPDVAFLQSGGFVVTWSGSGTGDTDGIFFRRYNADGTAAGGETRANLTTTNAQTLPVVTTLNDGKFVIAWQGVDTDIGSTPAIWIRRFNADGTAADSGDVKANTTTANSQVSPAISPLADGGFVVTWDGNGPSDTNGVFFQRFNSTSGTAGSETLVNTASTSAQLGSDVAQLADGGFVVTWYGDGTGDADGIYARRFDSAGAPLGSEFRINQATTNAQTLPAVASDGTFFVAWQAIDASSTQGVYLRKFAADGTPASAEVLVNNTTTNGQQNPAVAMTNNGAVMVVWDGDGPTDGAGIFARRYALDMTALGNEFLINTTTANTQTVPRVDAFTDGRQVVVWQDSANSGDIKAVMLAAADPGAGYAGPFRILSATPGETVIGGVDRILVTFNQEVLASSFTTADVQTLSGPSGNITATGITQLARNQFFVTFANQTAAGTYTLTLGPDITNLSSLKINQDWDATAGEATDDKFHSLFYLAAGSSFAAAVTSYGYDSRSRVTTVTAPNAAVTTYAYTDASQVASVTDPLSRVTSYTYDALARLITVTQPDPDGAGPLTSPVWQYSYDKLSNLRFVTDPLNNQSEFVYDVRNRRTDAYQPDPDGAGPATRPRTQFAYNAASELTSVTDPLSRVRSFTYDKLSRLLTDTLPDPDGAGSLTSPVWTYAYDAASNNTKITAPDPDGAGSLTSPVTDYAYDNLDRLITVTLPDPDAAGPLNRPVWSYEFDAASQMTKVTDPLSRITQYAYDNMGRNTTITLPDPDGGGTLTSPVWTYAYNARDQVTKVTDPLGRITRMGYDVSGRPTSTSNAIGGVTAVVYDNADQATSSIDELGRVTSVVYDKLGRPTSITAPDPDGPGSLAAPVTSFTYNGVGSVLTTVDPRGNTTTLAYDNLYRATSITLPDPDGAGSLTAPVTSFTYDAASQRLTVTDPLNRTTTFGYDNLGRNTTLTQPDPDGAGSQVAPVTTQAFDGLNRMTSVTLPDPDGAGSLTSPVYNYAYDGLSRLTQVTAPDPDGAGSLSSPITQFKYDGANQRTQVIDPLNRDTLLAYDNLGRLTTVTDELNQTTNLAYDAANNRTSVKDALQNVTRTTYDSLNRPINTIDSRYGITKFAYDAVGNLTSLVDGQQNYSQFEYDRLDRQTADTNQLGGRRTFAYDVASNLTKRVDRNGRIIEFTYDNLNRATAEAWKTSAGTLLRTLSFAFDAASQLTSAGDPDSSYAFTYDNLGRMLTVSNSGTPSAPTVVLTAAYDGLSRKTSVSASVNGTADFINTFTYDNLSRLTRVDQNVQAGGNAVAEKRVDFAYNAVNQFTSIARYKAVAGGSANEVATSTYGYDGLARITSLDHKIGTTTITGYTWAYDTLNRVTQYTSSVDGTSNYSYDATSQLIGVDHSFQTDESYVFDLTGNRAMSGWATGDNNRLTSDGTYTYEYDAEGNVTRRVKTSDNSSTEYVWDHHNRLTTVTEKNGSGTTTKVVSYTYDVFDRKIARKLDTTSPFDLADAAIERYVYDLPDGSGLDDVALEFLDPDGNGAQPLALKYRYLHGPAVDQVLAQEDVTQTMGTAGRVLWQLGDNLGTTRDVVNNATVRVAHVKYDSFGQITAITDNNGNAIATALTRYLFTGRDWDYDTKLQYNRARWYNPATGRWMSEDPLSFSAGDTNVSRYVGNGVTNATDPSGLEDETEDYTPYPWMLPADGVFVGGTVAASCVTGGFFLPVTIVYTGLTGVGTLTANGLNSVGQSLINMGWGGTILGAPIKWAGGVVYAVSHPISTVWNIITFIGGLFGAAVDKKMMIKLAQRANQIGVVELFTGKDGTTGKDLTFAQRLERVIFTALDVATFGYAAYQANRRATRVKHKGKNISDGDVKWDSGKEAKQATQEVDAITPGIEERTPNKPNNSSADAVTQGKKPAEPVKESTPNEGSKPANKQGDGTGTETGDTPTTFPTKGMGGRVLNGVEQAEFYDFGQRAMDLGWVENPNRTGSWGCIRKGRFEELGRIDVGESGMPGWRGRTHIHITGEKGHLPPNTPLPGEPNW